MNLLLEAARVCPAGHRNMALMSIAVRVNKKSLRETGPGPSFGWAAAHCKDCYQDLPPLGGSRWALIPDDQVRVDEYRAKRWPVTK